MNRYWLTALASVPLVVAGLVGGQGVGTVHAAEPTSRAELALLKSPAVTRFATPRAQPTSGLQRGEHPITEIVADRTARTSTWRDADGALSVREYAAPHFFRDAATGSWAPIDAALRPVPGASGRWEMSAGTWQANFGALGSAAGYEGITASGHRIAFTAVGSSPAAAPSISGSTATYVGAWPATSIIDTAGSATVKEDIVLSGPSAAGSYTFDVSGAALRADAEGGISLIVGAKTVARIPAPTVSVADGESTAAAAVDYQMSSANRLTVAVSKQWLDSLPSRAFPVLIDPTVASAANPATAAGYADAGSRQTTAAVGHNASGNWGGDTTFTVPAAPSASAGDQPYTLNGLIYTVSCGSCAVSSAQIYLDYNGVTNYSGIAAGQKMFTTVSNGFYGELSTQAQSYLQGATTVNIGFTGNTGGTYVSIPTADISAQFNFIQQPPPSSVTAPASGGILTTTTPTLTGAITDQHLCPNGDNGPTPCDFPFAVDYNFSISTSSTFGTGQVVAQSGWQPGPYTQKTSQGVTTITATPPLWTVPPGSLQNGVTYYVTVQDALYGDTTSDEWVGGFGEDWFTPPAVPTAVSTYQIKLGLGAAGPSPTDTVGSPPGSTSTPAAGSPSPGTASSSETVNLITGNLALDVGTPSMKTVGGAAGVTLAYNSGQSSINGAAASGTASYGLSGAYYLDSGNHVYPATTIAQRLDPTVALEGGTSDPPATAGLPADTGVAGAGYMVRWVGTITLPGASSFPAGTTFQLGGETTGGLRIFLNGSSTAIYNDWSGTAQPSGTVAFSTQTLALGTSDTIEVDDWEPNVAAVTSAELHVQENIAASGSAAASEQDVIAPSTWLSASATGLPPGWVLAGTAGQWTSASDDGSQVVIRSASGDTETFTQSTNGTYTPAAGDTDYLSSSSGHLQLSSSGLLYVFNTDGSIASVSSAADDRTPAALVYGYTPVSSSPGSAIVLTSITDPVSTRSIALIYGGQSGCASANKAPAGLLCTISYWDGTSAQLLYNSNAQLAGVTAPGGVSTLFGYDTSDRMVAIRDGLASDYVADNQPGSSQCGSVAAATCPFDTTINYDSTGRVASVAQPEPTAGAARPTRTYTYQPVSYNPGAGDTEIAIAGLNLSAADNRPAGQAQVDTYDDQSRIITVTDAAGNNSYTVWDSDDRPLITLDAAGEQTSEVYDANGNLTDSYGPALADCFTAGTSNPWPTDTGDPTPPSPIMGYLPVAKPQTTSGCKMLVPHTHSSFDDGITGLAVTYWANGQYAGSATAHGTGIGIGGTSASACADGTSKNTTALCDTWAAGSSPDGADANGQWTTQLTGALTIATAGTYTFVGTDSKPLSVNLDGTLLGTNTTAGTTTGGFTTALPLTAGTHQIELSLQGSTSTKTSYTLASGLGKATPTAIPLTQLDPNYHLDTTTTDADVDAG